MTRHPQGAGVRCAGGVDSSGGEGSSRSPRRTTRVLVVHPGAVGDVLVALPALVHLGRLVPGAARVVALMPRMCELFAGALPVPALEECVSFDSLGLHRLFVSEGDADLCARLRGFEAIVSWFGADEEIYRAHLASLGRPLVVARSRPLATAGMHVSRHLVETLRPLGPPPITLPAVRIEASHADVAAAAAWLHAHGLGRREAVVVHAGAGSPGKIWPGFGVLARRLRLRGVPLVGVTGPAERGRAPLPDDGPRIPMAEDWPLSRLAALQALARVFVASDSGPGHLAALVGCPTVALFGPTDPVVWAPGGGAAPHVTVLRGSGAPGDPWAGLTVERVLDAIDRSRSGP